MTEPLEGAERVMAWDQELKVWYRTERSDEAVRRQENYTERLAFHVQMTRDAQDLAMAAQADAARYRWLRDEGSLTWVPFRAQWRMTAAECDASIDREVERAAPKEQA